MSAQPNIRPFEPADVSPAAEYLATRHRERRLTYPLLPARFEDPDVCSEVVRSTMSFADGFAAEVDGRLIGFLFGIKNIPSPTSGSARLGPVRGSMIFAHGHAIAAGTEPYPVYNALFAALSETYMADGVFDHIAHVPAGDRLLDEAWSSLGFGRNAAVAARTTERLPATSTAAVRAATPDDLDTVYRIAASGNAFHARPPMFTPYVEPNTEAEVRAAYRKALADEGQALFLGYAEGAPAGLLWIEPPKGSPLFTPDDACYIGDTAVLPGARHAGLGTAILERALAWAREHGYRHATLHFVTANPVSSEFWKRNGFEPVMYHLRRRLDERIAWAQPPDELVR